MLEVPGHCTFAQSKTLAKVAVPVAVPAGQPGTV